MSVGAWLRGLFSPSRAEDEVAIRDEYGFDGQGEAELDGGRFGHAGAEAAQTSEQELDAFRAPPDPAP